MKLPVIQTCGECAWCLESPDDLCTHPKAGPTRQWPSQSAPPTWCPLRTGPDADRIAAPEAVASAAASVDARAYRAALTGDDWMNLTRALERLRSLT